MARSTKTAAPPASAELVQTNPRSLVIGANVRLDPRMDKEFFQSVKERGVLEPIVAYRNDTGDLVVLFGKRRTLAAVEVGLDRVPVYVVDRRPVDEDRLVDQLSENGHRAGLTEVERVGAYEQLAALGLSAAAIAKRTATPKDTVAAGLKVAASPAARTVAQSKPVTLDQAAVVAEFEGNDAAVAELVAAVDEGHGFDHVAQRLRDDRDRDEAIARTAAYLTAAGVKVVDRPEWNSKAKRLDMLRGDITAETHASCPGHAAYVEAEQDFENDEEPTEPGAPDPYVWRCDPGYVCTDPLGNGHELRFGGPSPAASPAAAGKSDADRDAAAAERREVIENNKAWVSAEKVRRDWLRQFLTRKTAPKTAAAFVAGSIASTAFALRRAMENGNTLAHELLGLTKPAGYGDRGAAVDKLLEGASDGRAQVVALGLVLAAYEEATSRESWRTVDTGTARYLRYLQEQGYELADVELLACGVKPKKAAAKKTAKPRT